MSAQETVQIPEILHKMWGQMTRPISMGCTISLDTLRNHYVTLARGSPPQCSFNPSSFQSVIPPISHRSHRLGSCQIDISSIRGRWMTKAREMRRGMGHERAGAGQKGRARGGFEDINEIDWLGEFRPIIFGFQRTAEVSRFSWLTTRQNGHYAMCGRGMFSTYALDAGISAMRMRK